MRYYCSIFEVSKEKTKYHAHVWRTLMKRLSQTPFNEEFKQAVSDHLNKNKMFMNPRTGTVQSLDLWLSEKDSEHPEQFIEKELIEVKLINDKWVQVN